MAAPPPEPAAKPALQSLPLASAYVFRCAEDVAAIIPTLVVLGVTDPNRTVEQSVLDKTFDVKYKIGIKYNERERLGPEWKPADGGWKKWVTSELRLMKMYASDTFNDAITKDVAKELKTNLDVSVFRMATKPVEQNFDDSDDFDGPLIYEYKLPKSFKVRIEINPHNPMVPPLNLHNSNTWGLKTRELVRDGINGVSIKHVRLLAQGDFCMADNVAELPIETYLADPRPISRKLSTEDQATEEKNRLAKAIKDTRHPTPFKLTVTIDWPSWCKAKAGPKPSPSIEDTPMTIPDDDLPLHATTPAPKMVSKRRPKSTAAIEDDPQHSQPAPVKAKEEGPREPSRPGQAQASNKMSVPPINGPSLPVQGHPSPKLRPVAASPFKNIPQKVHGHPSPKMGVVIKEETNSRGRHSTTKAKPLKTGKEASFAAAGASISAPPSSAPPKKPAREITSAPPSSAPSDMDKPGAIKIIWCAKDTNERVTKLGTSKRNCRACGANMSSFVALLDHLKSDQSHLGKEIKLQYWGDGQTVNVWMIDLPAGSNPQTKLFEEEGLGRKWNWLLDEEVKRASSTPFPFLSGRAPRPAPLEPRSSPFAPRLSSPTPPAKTSAARPPSLLVPVSSPVPLVLSPAPSFPQPAAPLSVSVFSPPQAVETNEDETEPAVVVKDRNKIALDTAEKLVDQTAVLPEYIRSASEATFRTVNGTQKDLILHDDVTRLPLRPGDNIVSYEHDREAQMRQTHIDAIWARSDLGEDEKDLWVVWDLYMLANPNMSRGAYKTQMPVTIKKFVCANWVWFHQRKSRTLAWMKKLGTLKVGGVITSEMATNGVRLLVSPTVPKEAWYRVDRERKWDNENLEENRRNWTALWNALVFLGERWDELPPVMEITVAQFIHVAGHILLMRDHAADLKLSILDKLFNITTKPSEAIMRDKVYLEDGLGRKIKWGDMLASDVVNLCHEEAMKEKFLDDEFRRYYTTRQKYFGSHADDSLEAKMKGLFRHHANEFRLWQWRRAHEVELHLSFMNGEIDVGLLCSVLPNLRMIGSAQIGGPEAPPLTNHPLVIVAPLMKPKHLIVEPPPTGKRIPIQKPYGERGFMECQCGTDVYESNTVRCCNAKEKGSRRCLAPYYHRECTEEFRKDESDGLFRPRNWYCKECDKKGWGVGEVKVDRKREVEVEMKGKSSGVEEGKTKRVEMRDLGSEVVHSDSAQLPARKKQKTTEKDSGWDKGR